MKKKVLVFPAGTEIGLEICRSLKGSKFVELYGGTSVSDHSEFEYERTICGFPYVDSEGFVDYLNKIISEYGIDCVYPAHDDVSVVLSQKAKEIKAQVVITDYDTTITCRMKKEMYNRFNDYCFVPIQYSDPNEIDSFPVFVRPNIGQGSKGAHIVRTYDELICEIKAGDDIVICEYLPGDEYTVDCLTGNSGELLSVKPRIRNRIRNGISVAAASIQPDESIMSIASTLNNRLRFRGAWFFQLKKNNEGKYFLLEASPRIAGTSGVSRNQGLNYALITLFLFWGYDVEVIDNGYRIEVDRALHSLYHIDIKYDTVYVDYDDTLIIDGMVNAELVRFIYQAHNDNKKVILLSKHSGCLEDDMMMHHLSTTMFDSVVHISDDDEKWRYITGPNSILIDDSFKERKEAYMNKNIHVFDIDMIECLIDDRKR